MESPPTPPPPESGEVRFEDLRRNALIETDPRSDFEAFLKAQAIRCAADGDPVFVFTSEGSPLHRMLEGAAGISLLLMSVDPEAARRAEAAPGRVSLLTLDKAHFLTLLDSLMATPGRVHVFLDSISSMVMALGFQETYKLLRQSIEIVGRSAGPRINLFAVMIRGTQSEAERNTLRSMFQVILAYDSSGVKVVKPPELKLSWTKPERSSAKGEPADKKGGGLRSFLGSLKGDRQGAVSRGERPPGAREDGAV